MTEIERSAWILMERIMPPISKGYMIRPGGPMPPPLVDLVSELGIFGAVIGFVTNYYYLFEKEKRNYLKFHSCISF